MRVLAFVMAVLRRGVALCAILALGWYGASVTLHLTGADAITAQATLAPPAAPEARMVAAPTPAQPAPVVPLFGVPPVARPAPPAPPPVARNTAYTLRGVFTDARERAFAMIEAAGVTAVYTIEDRLPGGELVLAFGADRVRIRGEEGDAFIAFDAPDTGGEQAAAEPAPPPRPADTRPVVEDARPAIARPMLRERLVAGDLLSALRVERVRATSGVIGMRIKWLREDPLVESIGLKRGDIVTSVNGQPVDNSAAMAGLLATLPETGEIVLELERRDGPRRLVIPVSNG